MSSELEKRNTATQHHVGSMLAPFVEELVRFGYEQSAFGGNSLILATPMLYTTRCMHIYARYAFTVDTWV